MKCTPQKHTIGSIPAGYFILFTRNGHKKVHVALFTNQMEPCLLDLNRILPLVNREQNSTDLSLVVSSSSTTLDEVVTAVSNHQEIIYTGTTLRTHIYKAGPPK